MFSVFLELVKRVGIFVIIGQTVLHFGISKEYEKYMKLVVSLMVVAQVIFAFGSYGKKDGTNSFMVSSEEYYERWEENMKELEKEFENRQELLNQNLEQRFQKKDGKETEEQGISINEIRIEKIVIR